MSFFHSCYALRRSIRYRIDPARADEFLLLMRESRRSRLAQGALRWELLRDLNDPGVYVAQITDASWTEHLRCAGAGWPSISPPRRRA